MEQTWRWWGPADPITLGACTADRGDRHRAPRCTTSRPARSGARRRSRERLRFIEAGREPRPALERGGEPAGAPRRSRSDAAISNRCSRPIGSRSATSRPAGVDTICYNFMPVLDWARTELRHPAAGRRHGAALQRPLSSPPSTASCWSAPGAEADHTPEVAGEAAGLVRRVDARPTAQRLLATIMAGLPGAFDRYDIPGLRGDAEALRRHRPCRAPRQPQALPRRGDPDRRGGRRADGDPSGRSAAPAARPAARSSARRRTSPPCSTLHPSPANGRDAVHRLARRAAGQRSRRHRPPLRRPHPFRASAQRRPRSRTAPSWRPSISAATSTWSAWSRCCSRSRRRRRAAGDLRWRIPFRPDHGHELIYDVGRPTHPGYPVIGRLKGLAEIRGVMTAVAALKGLPT